MDANATLQGLFIVAYFIAPWFLHYYVSRTFGREATPTQAISSS